MRVRVKICGITNPADAVLAAELGADAIGLNFYASSPRCIDMATARQIVATLPPFVEPVALFVNAPMDQVRRVVGELGIRTVQLHGDVQEPPSEMGVRWIQAFPVRDQASLDLVGATLTKIKPAAILVDAHVPGMFGGTGKVAPWELLATYRSDVPLILAGGLTPENVGAAIQTVRPYAVDVASGVESEPGKKDPEKMRRFIHAACGLALG